MRAVDLYVAGMLANYDDPSRLEYSGTKQRLATNAQDLAHAVCAVSGHDITTHTIPETGYCDRCGEMVRL